MSAPVVAIVPAEVENKRILRELLSRPDSSWTARDRVLYRDVLRREARRAYREDLDLRDELELGLEEKQKVADWLGLHVRYVLGEMETDAERERRRRRTRREAVTARDGAKAVTTGEVTECVACRGPMPRVSSSRRRWRRRDCAYCSDACRQRAYRARKGTP